MTCDVNQNGILEEQEAKQFIQQAYGILMGQEVHLGEEQTHNLFNAVQSVDPSYNGFNLDEFMQGVSVLAAWNVKGRSEHDSSRGASSITPQDRVNAMVDTSFNTTKVHLDELRNEVEVARLQVLAEKQLIEAQQSELAFEQEQLAQEKKEFEVSGAKHVAATAGQALLVEEEVKRRLKEEKAREEYEKNAQAAGGMDHDLRALQTFTELRNRQTVNYENVTEDDALADAMLAAEEISQKKLLMRYKRLKQEV